MAIQGSGRSNYVNRLNSVKEKVTHFLQAQPELRDNNLKLVSAIWTLEIIKQGYKPAELTAERFLQLYSEDRFTPADTITRASRKIQEETPELQGEHWQERQGLETEVRSAITQPTRVQAKGTKFSI
jgi:hypothetical protein